MTLREQPAREAPTMFEARRHRHRRPLTLILAAALAVAALGCRSEAPPPAPDVLATWDGGQITVADLDQHLMSLSADQRSPAVQQEVRPWLERRLLRLFERRVLLAEDNLAGLADDDSFQLGWEMQSRQILAQRYLEGKNRAFSISDEEVRSYFEANRERFSGPERRVVSNLLLAFPEEASEEKRQAICQRTEELRQQIVAGASFEEMARRHSDSSTAGAGGFVGAVRRDQLRGEVADVIFSLESGEVSPVVRTRAGCQLFYVQQMMGELEVTFESARSRIAEALAEQRRAEYYQQLLAEGAEALGVELPDRGRPPAIDPASDEPLFTVDERPITGRMVAAKVRSGTPPERAFPTLVDELIFSQMLRREEPQRAQQILDEAYEELAYQYLRREALSDRLTSLPQEVAEEYFERHRGRFVTDPQLEMVIYSWPIGPGDPLDSMHRPRRFAAQLTAAQSDPEEIWQRFADDPGVARQALPLAGLRELATQRPGLSPVLLEELSEGQVYGPYRHGDELRVVRVATYIPSRPQSFLEARDQVLQEYARTEGPRLEAGWFEELEQEHDFKLVEENLANFGGRLIDQLQGVSTEPAGGEPAAADETAPDESSPDSEG